jgi:hypothetical protein
MRPQCGGPPSLRLEELPDRIELPAFQLVFESQRSTEYVVLIPVIDEGQRILGQLRGMADARLGADVMIVDGGSSDGSMEPRRLADELGVHTLLVKTGPGRLSAQLRIGFAQALCMGYAGIITIDGNGKDDYRAVPAFIAGLAEQYDFIQGSRYLPGGIAENTPLDRELAVRWLHAPLISRGAGFRYTDTTNGFRGFSRRFLLDPRVRPLRAIFDTYNLHFYLAVRAPRLGFRVCELPVARRYPAAGRPPSKIAGIGGRLQILRQAAEAALGSYDPPG